MKRLLLVSALMTIALPAQAETMQFSCQRFKSNCTGEACDNLFLALKKDTERSILQQRKTQMVDYKIEDRKAVETLMSGQEEAADKGQPLVIDYAEAVNSYGKLIFSNTDSKGALKEKAEIEPTSGIYRYYLYHTDGSIQDVPVGEPYMAYFGWCKDVLKPMDDEAAPAAPAEPAASAPAQ